MGQISPVSSQYEHERASTDAGDLAAQILHLTERMKLVSNEIDQFSDLYKTPTAAKDITGGALGLRYSTFRSTFRFFDISFDSVINVDGGVTEHFTWTSAESSRIYINESTQAAHSVYLIVGQAYLEDTSTNTNFLTFDPHYRRNFIRWMPTTQNTHGRVIPYNETMPGRSISYIKPMYAQWNSTAPGTHNTSGTMWILKIGDGISSNPTSAFPGEG